MCNTDPFLNDQNFILSVLSLEELGATGNKVSPVQLVLHWITLRHLYASAATLHSPAC